MRRVLWLLGLGLGLAGAWLAVSVGPAGPAGPGAVRPAPASPGGVAGAGGPAGAAGAALAEEPSPGGSGTRIATQAFLSVRVVRRETGAPVEGAALALFSGSSPPAAGALAGRSRTDHTGAARMALAAGASYDLEVLPPESVVPVRRQLRGPRAGETVELRVEVATPPVLVYWGRLVAEAGGGPVASAPVLVLAGGANHSSSSLIPAKRPLLETSSDADGLFEVRLASWRGLTLRIDAPGYGPVLATPADGHASAEEAEVLRLSAAASLEATVRDPGGRALSGIEVVVSTEARHLARPRSRPLFAPDPTWSRTTGAAGSCLFEDLPSGVPLEFALARDGVVLQLPESPTVLSPGIRLEREWRVGPGRTFEGTVVDEHGAPVPGCELWIAGDPLGAPSGGGPCYLQPADAGHATARVRADEHGRFALRDLPGGSWWIGPAATGEAQLTPLAHRFELYPESAEPLVVRVERGGRLEGRVTGPDGEPLPGQPVEVGSERVQGSLEVRADADGRFRTGPLAGGAHRVRAASANGYAASPWVEALPGQSGLLLTAARPVCITGVVVDALTGEACRARLVASPEGSGSPSAATWTGTDASFLVEGLRPGSYDLAAVTPDGRVGALRGVPATGPGGAPVTLEVREGATLELTWLGPADRAEVVVWSGAAAVARASVARGTRAELAIPSGRTHLALTPLGGAPLERELEARPGERVVAVFPAP